jgi:hypothetical protein
MRYGNCLNCDIMGDRELVTRGTLPEELTGDCHHHHTVRCGSCGSWWFDDYVTGGLGLPVASRRDTVLCACPEDGQDRYRKTIVMVPLPEDGCRCTASDVNKYAVLVNLRGRS